MLLLAILGAASCGGDAQPEPSGPPQAEIEQAYHSGYLYGFKLARKVDSETEAEAECLGKSVEWPQGPERDEFQRGCIAGWKES